jgi:hypothetical protein
MTELIRSNDLVHLSWAQHVLTEAGIPFLLADLHTSSIEGGICALPRRLLVPDEQVMHAQRALSEARSLLDGVDEA